MNQYIITEEQLKAWRKGCVNLSDPHIDDDTCKKCKHRGKGLRVNCCDFDDNEMEKIFRSHPYNEQSIRQDEREKVLDGLYHFAKDNRCGWGFADGVDAYRIELRKQEQP